MKHLPKVVVPINHLLPGDWFVTQDGTLMLTICHMSNPNELTFVDLDGFAVDMPDNLLVMRVCRPDIEPPEYSHELEDTYRQTAP